MYTSRFNVYTSFLIVSNTVEKCVFEYSVKSVNSVCLPFCHLPSVCALTEENILRLPLCVIVVYHRIFDTANTVSTFYSSFNGPHKSLRYIMVYGKKVSDAF